MIESFQDIAPSGQDLTDYDKSHVKLYMRLLDAAADGAHWEEAVRVLGVRHHDVRHDGDACAEDVQ